MAIPKITIAATSTAYHASVLKYTGDNGLNTMASKPNTSTGNMAFLSKAALAMSNAATATIQFINWK